MSSLKWNMDAKRRKPSVSVMDEQERRDKDRAAKWLERAEASAKQKPKESRGQK